MLFAEQLLYSPTSLLRVPVASHELWRIFFVPYGKFYVDRITNSTTFSIRQFVGEDILDLGEVVLQWIQDEQVMQGQQDGPLVQEPAVGDVEAPLAPPQQQQQPVVVPPAEPPLAQQQEG